MPRHIRLAILIAIEAAFVLSPTAEAHNTTSTCAEEWQSSFAIGNSYNNYRMSIMSWNRLKSGGGVELCPAGPTAAGCQDVNGDQECTAVDTAWPWPGYQTSCWFWRRRCGQHYIRWDDDAGHGHTWFEEWNPLPTNPDDNVLRICTPNDGKGGGFVRINSAYQTPNCQNWTQGNLRNVKQHAAGFHTILWVEHTTDHQPVIFDLEYMQVFPSMTVEVAIKTGSGENDWWVTTLPPNQPSATETNGYQYWDVRSWGFEVERVVIGTAIGGGAPVSIGGIRYSTPSNSGWPTQSNTINPTGDAYIRDGASANSNFGTATTLDVKTTNTTGSRRRALLEFDISALTSTIVSAKVRVHGNSVTTAKTHGVYDVFPFDFWSEPTVTWNNQPTSSNQLSSKSVGTTAAWHEFDVTARVQALKGGSFLSAAFELKSNVTSNDAASSFHSREGTNKPQLVVVSK